MSKLTVRIVVLLLLTVLFISCVYDDVGGCLSEKAELTIAFAPTDYIDAKVSSRSAEVKTRALATTEEMQLNNVYIILFSTTAAPLKYFVETTTNTPDLKWIAGTEYNQVKIYPKDVSNNYMTLSAVGLRNVYVIGNVNATLKGALDDVNMDTETELAAVLTTTEDPWTISITSALGLLMEGHTGTGHDFATNYIAGPISLTRAVAKVKINVKLAAPFQSSVHTDYGYKYLNFGKETYILEKADAQTTGIVDSHTDWQTAGFTFTPATGTVIDLSLTTYINEYKNTSSTDPTATIELRLPFNNNDGMLPPPEFGDGYETHRLVMPLQVVRNTYYEYDVEITK